MAMKPLDPAPKQTLTDSWELVGTSAGRTRDDAIRATIHLWNSEPKLFKTLALGDSDSEAFGAFAQTIADQAGIEIDAATSALVQLAVAVEASLRERDAQDSERGPSQATRLVDMAVRAGIALFHTPEGDAYVTIPVDGHGETWPLKVRGFRRWLSRIYYQSENTAPGSQAVQDAIGVLEGMALFDGEEYPVFTRLAEQDGVIYIDLANDQWQAVEVSGSGWRIVDKAPVKFRRPNGTLPLPMPVQGGTIQQLKPYLNVRDDADWILTVSYEMAAFRPSGPYPILVINGEQGSAKSTQGLVLRSLIDPNEAMLRTTPRDERDLVIAAKNGWVIALDNLSHLPLWLSDALCRLSTGSGFGTRLLYANDEEALFSAKRPIVINGIEELATRGDLLDRAIVVILPEIPEENRQDEKDFWDRFDRDRPELLGAILDIISKALTNLPGIQLSSKPRMADFALWSCAVAQACGWELETPDGELLINEDAFLHAYTENRNSGNALALDASILTAPIRTLVENGKWTGTATELLDTLNEDAYSDEKKRRQKGWPKSPQVLSNMLRRVAPNLRKSGVPVGFERGAQRTITLGGGDSELPF